MRVLLSLRSSDVCFQAVRNSSQGYSESGARCLLLNFLRIHVCSGLRPVTKVHCAEFAHWQAEGENNGLLTKEEELGLSASMTDRNRGGPA